MFAGGGRKFARLTRYRNFTISLALSAGTLMASAGTPYHLVPAYFYPCTDGKVSMVFNRNSFPQMTDFSRLGALQAVTYTLKVVVSKKLRQNPPDRHIVTTLHIIIFFR